MCENVEAGKERQPSELGLGQLGSHLATSASSRTTTCSEVALLGAQRSAGLKDSLLMVLHICSTTELHSVCA